jgi:hypothetical protein
MRLNFEFSEERINDLRALQTETDSDSMKELFNNALTMLEWAVREVKNGNEIAAVNDAQRVYRVLITPLLERVARKNAKETKLAAGATH